MRRFFLLIFGGLVLPILAGEEISGETVPPQENPVPPFTLSPFLRAVITSEIAWRPDWPEDVPPDAFIVKGGGTSGGAPRGALSISLGAGGGSDGGRDYRLRWNGGGRLEEFPVFINGALLQANASYNAGGDLEKIGVRDGNGADEQSRTIEFSPPFPLDAGVPSALEAVPFVRGGNGNNFFVFIGFFGEKMTETWYDADGNFLMFVDAVLAVEPGDNWVVISQKFFTRDFSYLETCALESGGQISQVKTRAGTFSALYSGKGRPVYWGDITLQWDERGFLVRRIKSGLAGEGELPSEYRYDYDTDEKGNWIKRRETAYGYRFGLLVPLGFREWERRIIYREN
jgi:hypothetical protein